MDDAQQERAARNEAVARRLNEKLTAYTHGNENMPDVLLCECGLAECVQVLEISSSDYERVRSSPRRFILHPGHENPEVETVVEQHTAYVVVEKQARAGEVAEDTDPRG